MKKQPGPALRGRGVIFNQIDEQKDIYINMKEKDVFCIHCGKKTKYGKKFCPACGAKIDY